MNKLCSGSKSLTEKKQEFVVSSVIKGIEQTHHLKRNMLDSQQYTLVGAKFIKKSLFSYLKIGNLQFWFLQKFDLHSFHQKQRWKWSFEDRKTTISPLWLLIQGYRCELDMLMIMRHFHKLFTNYVFSFLPWVP